MSKFSQKIKTNFVNGLTLTKGKPVFPIIVLVLASAVTLTLFIGRFNFLAPIAVALSMFVALCIAIDAFINGRISLYLLISYGVSLFGAVFTFIVFGADGFAKRLGYNLMISSAALVAFAGLILMLFLHKKSAEYVIGVVLSLTMLGGSVLYFLAMAIRLKPTVDDLSEGQDEYLKAVSNLKRKEDSPNVLMILMDDMGYADLSSYSYLGSDNATIKTPNIDSIATDGIMMDNFYSSSPVCSPARFSYFTGRYQSRGYLDNVVFPTEMSFEPFDGTRYYNPYQFLNNVDGLLGDEITFAEAFQSYGYKTNLVGKWNLGDYGEYLPTNQGFDYFYGSYYVNDMISYNIVEETNGEGKEVIAAKDILDQSKSTARFTQKTKDVITEAVDNGDKFLTCYTSPWPHYPIFSGEENDVSDDNYIDCIEEFDKGVGEILQLLKDKGVYDDTLIVFTSDNGPGREGATGALRGRKNTVFDGGHKVPLLACYVNGGIGKGAGLNGSHTVTAPSMIFDLFPTLLKYAGIDILPSDRIIDGVSLNALWQGDADRDTKIHDALFYTKKGKVQGVQMPVAVTVDGKEQVFDFKYYENVHTENSAFIDQFYKNYLFNLDNDPIEAYNVAKVYPDAAKQMLAALKQFRKSLKDNPRGII